MVKKQAKKDNKETKIPADQFPKSSGGGGPHITPPIIIPRRPKP